MTLELKSPPSSVRSQRKATKPKLRRPRVPGSDVFRNGKRVTGLPTVFERMEQIERRERLAAK